ncbi:MAG: nitroreductase [archaeon]|nr:nitroreductase [archaeon]
MIFDKPINEVMKSRKSQRNYISEDLSDEIIQKMTNFLEKNNQGPLGNKVRFKLSKVFEDEKGKKQIGTYGFIKNAQYFLYGAIEEKKPSIIDYGYTMQKNVLYATSLELGTCWLGIFKKKGFMKIFSLEENEFIPSITALGPVSEDFNQEKVFNRVEWDKLFFKNDSNHPLLKNEIEKSYLSALEMVRIGPSSNNSQPWRIIYEEDKDIFHFFMQKIRMLSFIKIIPKIQHLDIGISMCNFELTLNELGLQGIWNVKNTNIENIPDNFEYVVSWKKIRKT